ncbi:MAG: hypothetical protein ACT4PN_00005, partial [Nitrospiraceae bacterium]
MQNTTHGQNPLFCPHHERFVRRHPAQLKCKICFVRYLQATQLQDGGWPIYYGGPAEISASVKAYFALKWCGVSADEPFMVR